MNVSQYGTSTEQVCLKHAESWINCLQVIHYLKCYSALPLKYQALTTPKLISNNKLRDCRALFGIEASTSMDRIVVQLLNKKHPNATEITIS